MERAYKEYRVISNEMLGANVFVTKVKGSFKAEPGQFYMVKAWQDQDPILGRPLSILDIDEEGNLYFLTQVVGRGTKYMQKLRKNDRIYILGPLGNKFPMCKENEKVALVGGSVGIAPLLYLARKLRSRAFKIELYAGFRSEVFYLDEFKPFVNKILLSTEDGSLGYKGFITDIINTGEYDRIYTCGPYPMMRSLLLKAQNRNKVICSMESRMACGVGSCLGCSFETSQGMRRVCKDGPIFGGGVFILD